MTEAAPDAVKVHITGTDYPAPPRITVHTTFYKCTVAQTVADGNARLVLPHAPNRIRATLIITGTAGETAILAGSSGEAQNQVGAVVGPGTTLDLRGDDEVWLGAGTGVSIVVGVISEYA